MELEIQITFVCHEHDIDNDTLYQIRRCVAETNRDSGFGDVIEDVNDTFRNEHLTPNAVAFIGDGHREMFIGFIFNLDEIQHGDLPDLIMRGFPFLINTITERFPDVRTHINMSYAPIL